MFTSESEYHEYEERDTEVALICPEGPKRKRRKPRDPRGRPEGERPDCRPAGPRGKRDARALGSSVQSTTTPGCVSRTRGAERGAVIGGK